MEKIYSTDWDICGSFLQEANRDSPFFPDFPRDFLNIVPTLFDKGGDFNPLLLKDAVKSYGDTFLILANSDKRESRYLGISGLLRWEGEEYDPLLWSAFYDTYHPIRALLVESFQRNERARLFNEIFKKLTGDPRQVIREKAFKRIKKDFSDLFSFRINNFTAEEQYRLLLFLDGNTTHDFQMLCDFLTVGNRDLSSRALYRLQKDRLGKPLIWPESSKELNLIRYHELPRFCQNNLEQFPQVFALLDDRTPPVLTARYITELIGTPYMEDRLSLYETGIELIGRMCNSRVPELINSFFNNGDVKEHLGPKLARLFTRTNQFFTAPLLERYYKSESNLIVKNALLKAGGSFSFPCLPEGAH
jgi:hypothetical protein